MTIAILEAYSATLPLDEEEFDLDIRISTFGDTTEGKLPMMSGAVLVQPAPVPIPPVINRIAPSVAQRAAIVTVARRRIYRSPPTLAKLSKAPRSF